MGCCSSKPSGQTPSGRRAFPAPLPPPMQDNMNELLNRWRHGEVNLLQRRFRLARAQAVKHSIASKILGSLAAPSSNSNSGTATSAATSANRDGSACFGEDGSTSPVSRDGTNTTAATAATASAELDSKRLGESATGGPAKVGVGAVGSNEARHVVSLGDAGGARAGMDKEAFLRVFPELQGLPVEVQRSSFRLFDCVGRGSLDFRNFCRALALCCRGSRDERLRFLFDLFSGASQPKHYGTGGADGGARDATSASGGGTAAAAATACLSEAELDGLKKQLGLSAGDADPTRVGARDHEQFQSAPGGSGLSLSEYFEWAAVHASDEALDRALRPFYLLPSPQQEKDKVLAQLMDYNIEEGQSMCLVAAPWWSYWSNYAALTKEDVLRVPERLALGLHKTEAYLDQASLSLSAEEAEPVVVMGIKGVEGVQGATASTAESTLVDAAATPQKSAGDEMNGDGERRAAGDIGAGDGNGNGHAHREMQATGGGKDRDRAVPTTLARRPHEIDNSSLQGGAEWEVAPNLALGDDYVMLPKPLWDIMVDWYGGGPVFCRKVVNVSSGLSAPLQLPKKAREAGPAVDEREEEAGAPSPSPSPSLAPAPASARTDGLLMVDLYPLALHVSVCDAAGRPGVRERLVLTSHHVHVSDMLLEALDNSNTMHGLSRGLSLGAVPSDEVDEEPMSMSENVDAEREQDVEQIPEEDGSGDGSGSVSKQETPSRRASSDSNRTTATEHVRLWVLEISTSGLIDTPRTHAAASSSGARRPRFSHGGGQALGVDPQSGLDRWKLVKAEEEGLTLSALGLIGGEKVMLEYKTSDGKWPRRRYIEDPGFRQFRENDRVDAMDYQGRWFRGQVVEVGTKSSSKIIIDSEGPVGKKKSNRHRQRPDTGPLLEDVDREGRVQEVEVGHVQPGDSLEVEGQEGRAAARAKSKSSSGQSQRQRRVSGRERGSRSGESESGSGGGSGGGPSRRRMRVRVHFDRFASQWDEWYDSKSLKLAPEFSHTAPAVPVPTPLRPRDDANGDAETGEEPSPSSTAARGGAGAPASASRHAGGSGSTFPPPVGRFPGDSSNGGGNTHTNWNSRSQGVPRTVNGASGNAEEGEGGISNYGGGALNRRSNTPGKPPVAGACGLVNVGNTCYLNSAVQCLSHTPLLRAYLLSDMWVAEVNKYNPLGTQGKLVEDFVSLLKSLWSQEFLCVFPSKFKRGLIKYKPQFAGNEQQDSQEFLAEMLDALHEDVNRVIDKPYVPAPEDDEAESGRSDQELADKAWDRHVQRNRSVIVDLFQGQLKMECRCTVCNKKSVTFDPFMYLSVPIPVRNEKLVGVVMIPRIRTRYLTRSDTGVAEDGMRGSEGEVAEFNNPRQVVPVQYGVMLPRLGEMSDLKRALSELTGIPSSSLVIAILQQSLLRVMQDTDPLTEVRDDNVVAFEMAESIPNSVRRPKPTRARPRARTTPKTSVLASSQATGASPEALPAPTTLVLHAVTVKHPANSANSVLPEAEVVGLGDIKTTVETATASEVRVDEIGEGEGENAEDAGEGEGGEDEDEDEEETEGSDSDLDDDRPPTSMPDHRTPDERCTAPNSFPSKLRDLELGWRLDALDGQGGWYAATVVEIYQGKLSRREGHDKYPKNSTSLAAKGDDQHLVKRKTEYLVKVHFDNFTSKWDESYGEQEWREKKLQPLFSKARPNMRTQYIQVVHRKTIRVPTSGAHGQQQPSNRDGVGHGMRSERDRGDVNGRDVKEPPATFITAKALFGLPFFVRCPPARSTRFLWRLVVQQASRFVAGSSGGRSSKAGGKDRMSKAAAGSSQRPGFDISAAWVARAAVGLENGISDEKLAQLLPFTVKFVLKQNPLTEVCSVDLIPDRWRAATSLLCPKLILALEWKDASRDYLDILAGTFEHPSFLELENNAQSIHSGLSLEQCLEAYTKEETLEEEDSWYCSNCQAHRRGVMKIDLWKMPDVLVIHMKRFHCYARWREKIKTLVIFPHSGLDMSGFVSSNSAHRHQAGGGQAGMVYDLFGVVNHMGGMTGGHYTACCRSSPCSKDGVEEVTGWGLEHPWLHFDDEFVEEMAPDKIVSDAAYVLFYRRRRLTPSNVINMTI